MFNWVPAFEFGFSEKIINNNHITIIIHIINIFYWKKPEQFFADRFLTDFVLGDSVLIICCRVWLVSVALRQQNWVIPPRFGVCMWESVGLKTFISTNECGIQSCWLSANGKTLSGYNWQNWILPLSLFRFHLMGCRQKIFICWRRVSRRIYNKARFWDWHLDEV